MEARPVRDTQAALIRWMGIMEANSAGFVHGGTVMKMCDEAAGIAAVKHSRCRALTAAMDRMTFLHPVHIGQLLTCRASVNAAWRTSMEVGVRVEAEDPAPERCATRAPPTSRWSRSTTRGGRPRCRRWSPSRDEERRMREAELRRQNRLNEREQIRAGRSAGT